MDDRLVDTIMNELDNAIWDTGADGVAKTIKEYRIARARVIDSLCDPNTDPSTFNGVEKTIFEYLLKHALI